MRVFPVLMFVLACTSVARAQDKAQAAVDPAPLAVSAPAQMPAIPQDPTRAAGSAQNAPAAEGSAPAHRARVTWEQRFTQANVTHDGHLTLEQAKSGYAAIARHFQDIDVAKKGYVTEDDIRAWHKTHRATRRGQSADASTMQPQQAFQRFFPATMQINTAADRTVPRVERAPDPAAMTLAAPLPEISAGSDAPN